MVGGDVDVAGCISRDRSRTTKRDIGGSGAIGRAAAGESPDRGLGGCGKDGQWDKGGNGQKKGGACFTF